MQRLVVLAGPTASGKTHLAVTLAERLGAELIGADSVQVYRRLDLGSAKPTPEELRGVRHHLLDVVDLDAHYDASRYVADADAAIAEVRARGKVPLVVGGTGLYIQALVRGLAMGIPADTALRAQLHARASSSPEALAAMHTELAKVDADYAAKIHPTDPIRIVRALEVFTLSGVPFSEHHRRHAAQPPRYDARVVALEVPRPELSARIAKRARQMLASGWIDEVNALLTEGYAPDLKPLRSVGYAEVVAWLRGGGGSVDALHTAVVKATKGFAKRQRTWFRGEDDITWLAPDEVAREAFADAWKSFLDGE